jgi:hypothetical protein
MVIIYLFFGSHLGPLRPSTRDKQERTLDCVYPVR